MLVYCWDVLQMLLVSFRLIWKMSELDVLSDVVPHEEYVVWIRFFEMCPTLHQQECSLTVSRGHYQVVLASSVNFPRNE